MLWLKNNSIYLVNFLIAFQGYTDLWILDIGFFHFFLIIFQPPTVL